MIDIKTSKAKYYVTKTCLESIENYFNNFSREYGGALGIKAKTILLFFPLENDNSTGENFSPAIDSLNDANKCFNNQGAEFSGIIHSHPISKNGGGMNLPSKSDIDFCKCFLEANKSFKRLLFPIITLKESQKDIAWYIYKNGKIFSLKINIL